MLIESSLVHDYSHLGFNKRFKFEKFRTHLDLDPIMSYRDLWLSHAKQQLIENNITVLFMLNDKKIDKDLNDFCIQNSILVLNLDIDLYVKIKQTFATSEKDPLIYLDDFESKKNIEKLNFSLNSTKLRNSYLSIEPIQHSNNKNTFFTIMLETRLKAASSMHKETLFHNLKRLENVFNKGFYVQGEGHLERYLFKELSQTTDFKNDEEELSDFEDDENSIDKEEKVLYINLIRNIFASVFKDMFEITSRNKNEKDSDNIYYDDLFTKLEAFRLGCFICKCLLQADFSIKY